MKPTAKGLLRYLLYNGAMKKITSKQNKSERNWPLVVIALIVIAINAVLLVIGLANTATLGWWALLIALAALTSIFLSVMAIKQNNPAWLLLDLIIPN